MTDKPTQGLLTTQTLKRYWQLIAIFAVFLYVQWPILISWWNTWNAKDSYYSHGPLVSFMAVFMVWVHRKRLASVQIKPCWAGYVLLLGAVMLFLVGNWTLSATIRAAAFILMVLGILLSLLGKRMTWLLIIPVLFLFSMMPIAQSKLDQYTASMQWKSAAVASKILTYTGYTSDLQGSTITADGLPGPLRVAAECSGLKTLISIVTFTVFLIYISKAALWKKLLLLAVSFPLSLFVNSLRIAMIGYAGAWTGSAEAMHKFHNSSGYLGLVICFILLFGLASLLKVKMMDNSGNQSQEDSTMNKYFTPEFKLLPVMIVLVLLAVAGYSRCQSSPIYPQSKGNLVRTNIPMKFDGWTGQDQKIDKLSLEILKDGDLLSRIYMDSTNSRDIQLFISASKTPDGFHDPHICLPGGGNMIIGEQTIRVPIDKPYMTILNARLLHTSNDYGESLVLYWYMRGRESMPLTSDARAQIQQNLRKDLIRLILHPGENQEISKEVENRQFIWYRFSTTIDYDKETDLKELEAFIREFVANVHDFGSM